MKKHVLTLHVRYLTLKKPEKIKIHKQAKSLKKIIKIKL